MLAEVDERIHGHAPNQLDRWQVVEALQAYAVERRRDGMPLRAITRHVLGLFNGLPGARAWRRLLSDPRELAADDPALLLRAARLVGSAG